jgi:hypothetical protein
VHDVQRKDAVCKLCLTWHRMRHKLDMVIDNIVKFIVSFVKPLVRVQ